MTDLFIYALTGHTSAATISLGLEPDQAKWEIVQKDLNGKQTGQYYSIQSK